MDFYSLARKRYSCRSLSGEAIEPEKIERIIETGLMAPTACNNQPFKLWTITSPEAVEKIASCMRTTWGAKTFIVVGADSEHAWNRPSDDYNFADVDASIVATHIMMQIEEEGLATTWVGHFKVGELKEAFPSMKPYNLIAIFPIGYSTQDDASAPGPRHFERKDTDEMVIEL